MELASASTSCLRTSKRDTAIDTVKARSKPRIPRMAAGTTGTCVFVISSGLVSAQRPKRNPASAATKQQREKRQDNDQIINPVEGTGAHK